jgi:chromatin segregation and condensation protein Rec8/ScpA/Scc1 (kleisin family)
MRKKSKRKSLMKRLEEYKQFDLAMKLFQPYDNKPKTIRVRTKSISKSDYVIGKMTVKSDMLNPVNKNSEDIKKVSLNNRLKNRNKKEALKWMKKINKAEGTLQNQLNF